MAELGLYIGVGIGAGAVVLGGLLVLFLCFRRRQTQAAQHNGGEATHWGTTTTTRRHSALDAAEEGGLGPKRPSSVLVDGRKAGRSQSPQLSSPKRGDRPVKPPVTPSFGVATTSPRPQLAVFASTHSNNVSLDFPHNNENPLQRPRSSSSASSSAVSRGSAVVVVEGGTSRPRSRQTSQCSTGSRNTSPVSYVCSTPTGVPSIKLVRESAPHIKSFVQRHVHHAPPTTNQSGEIVSPKGTPTAEGHGMAVQPAPRPPRSPSVTTITLPADAFHSARAAPLPPSPADAAARPPPSNKKRSVVVSEGDSDVFALSVMPESTANFES